MISGKKVLGVTLARGGSKSIPKKNIYPINGRPLIGYTIEECLKSKYIDSYLVSTDSNEIASVASDLGAEVPFTRPSDLASDSSSSADALCHAVNWTLEQGRDFDIIVELMVTNPLKKAKHIDECIEMMLDQNVDYCVAVQRVYDHHPARLKYIEDGVMHDFYPEAIESRRQDLHPQAYVRAGSIYCMKASALLANNARYGKNNTAAYIMPDECVVNIDTPMDLALAKKILETGNTL